MPNDLSLIRFGRRFAPDDRDKRFSVWQRLAAAPSVATRHYWFSNGWWGDQGTTSQCVAYAFMHWLEDGPAKHGGPAPMIDPAVLYHEAQQLDEWPGDDYDGTSVRGAAKALVARGLISDYWWATTVDEVIQTLLQLGPLVVGTNWYSSMMNVDARGFVRVGGSLAGGHGYKLDGVNIALEMFRIKNSWGRSWGVHGFAFISFADFERLLREDGEAAIATEVGTLVPEMGMETP